MTIKFRTRSDFNLIIFEHIGSVLDDEFLAFYKALYESDTFDPLMNQIVDLRQADSTKRQPEVLRQFAEFVNAALAGITKGPKVAVIAPGDLSFGLARMYEAFASEVPYEFGVFRNLNAALAWLNLPEDLHDFFDDQDNQSLL